MRLLPIVFMLIPTFLLSQWTDNYSINTLVTDTHSGDVKAIRTADGNYYITYWDIDTDYCKLMVQLLDNQGYKKFGNEGIIVNPIIYNGSFTVNRSEAIDYAGNIVIAYCSTNDGNGYIHKISQLGEQLLGNSGIVISNAMDLKVITSSENFILAGWHDTEKGKGCLMKYQCNGQSMWDIPLIIDSPDSTYQLTSIGEMASLSDGSFIILFHIQMVPWNPFSYLYCQRISSNGTFMWEHPIAISNLWTRSNMRYSILQNADTVYLGYFGSDDTRFDSFVQRINPDGTLPWGENGTDFSLDANYFETSTSILLDNNSRSIWSTSTICNYGQNQNGQSIQKFDVSTGKRLLGDSAKVLFAVSDKNWVAVDKLQLLNTFPSFLFSNDISDGVNSIQLGVVILDESGNFLLDEAYQMIATSQGSKTCFAYLSDKDDQAVAVWSENRDGEKLVFAQNLILNNMSVPEIESIVYSLYPSPIGETITIYPNKSIAKIENFDACGQLLIQTKDITNINVSNLLPGIYFVKISTIEGTFKTIKTVRN